MNAKILAAPITDAPRNGMPLSIDRFGVQLVFILLCGGMAFSSEDF
ncbi:ABC transporter permease, partial [Corynebacterium pseudodiphtheriticum]